MVKIKKCKDNEIEKKMEMIKEKLYEFYNNENNDNEFQIVKKKACDNDDDEIKICKKRKNECDDDDDEIKICKKRKNKYDNDDDEIKICKKRKNECKNDDIEVQKKKYKKKSSNISFFCSNDIKEILQKKYEIARYIDKIYDKNLYSLEDLTQNTNNLFSKFYIKEMFQKKEDIINIDEYVHAFEIIVNNNKELLKISKDNKELNIHSQQMSCMARFFMIGARNCSEKIPNIRDIFSDEKNLEITRINPLYEVILDQTIIINSTENINPYFVFIKWKLKKDEKTLEQIEQLTYYYGYITTYPDFFSHDFALVQDNFKHIYHNINYNNEEMYKRLNELERLVKNNQGK